VERLHRDDEEVGGGGKLVVNSRAISVALLRLLRGNCTEPVLANTIPLIEPILTAFKMPANPMHGDLGKLMAGTCVFGKFYF
jgi:hypothetical protein